MKKFLLLSVLSLVPMGQALADVTVMSDMKESAELYNTTTGKKYSVHMGSLSVPSGIYNMNLSCGTQIRSFNLVEGKLYKIYNTRKGCSIQMCTSQACPQLR
jgi:hypothetical protein